MKSVKTFPRKYTTSSAAYRVIRQLTQAGDTRSFTVDKLGVKDYNLSVKEVMTIDEFMEKQKTIFINETQFKHFPDGVKGVGYYELKTGNRRRPNSLFLNPEEAMKSVCEV